MIYEWEKFFKVGSEFKSFKKIKCDGICEFFHHIHASMSHIVYHDRIHQIEKKLVQQQENLHFMSCWISFTFSLSRCLVFRFSSSYYFKLKHNIISISPRLLLAGSVHNILNMECERKCLRKFSCSHIYRHTHVCTADILSCFV